MSQVADQAVDVKIDADGGDDLDCGTPGSTDAKSGAEINFHYPHRHLPQQKAKLYCLLKTKQRQFAST